MVIQHHDHSAMWPLVLSPTLARLGSLLERRLAPPFYRSTPVVTLSRSSAEDLVTGLGHRRDLVHVVEPGIHHRYGPGGIPEQPPLVLSVGRLMQSKRVDVLIRSYAEALRSVQGLRLEIIGEGPEEDALRRLATELGVASSVSFCGRVTDDVLLDAYRRATLVASASISEGWGMTITEAAACGTPAVVSDIAGHRDAVLDGRSGLLVAEPSDMAAGLVAVAGDQGHRADLSAGAVAFAARFDWDRTATEAFRVLVSTVRGR
jgi:glycosyltransferase involved in cell wall biosynthesis